MTTLLAWVRKDYRHLCFHCGRVERYRTMRALRNAALEHDLSHPFVELR